MSEAATAEGRGSSRVDRQSRTGGLADSEALTQAQKTIERQERELADERKGREAAEGRAQQATTRVVAASTAQLAEREGSLTAQIEAAKKAETAAMASKKSARAAGDDDASDAADAALLDARVDLKYWSHELNVFKAQKPALEREIKAEAEGAAAAGNSGPTEHSRKWLSDHPKFNTDARYHADALAAHGLAIQNGHKNGSLGYIDFINGQLESLHGKEHGKAGSSNREHQGGGRREESSSSSAAPVNRDTAGPMTYRTNEGHDLRVTISSDGKKQLSGQIPAKWVEAAGWVNMEPVAYAISKIESEEEAADGRGPTMSSEGAFYR